MNGILGKTGGGFDRVAPWQAAAIAGLVAWLVTTFFYAPPLWMPLAGGGSTPARIDDFNALCADPLTRDLGEPILAYRITTPALAWLLGLRGFSGVILQYLAIPLSLGLIFHALAARTSRRDALLLTVGIACSYTMIWTNTKPGFPDAVTHLAAAVLLLSRKAWLIVAMTILGTLNDERFVLAIPFLILWHARTESFAAILRSTWKEVAAFVVGLGIVVLVRNALKHGIIGPGIPDPEVYEAISGVLSLESLAPLNGWKSYLVNVLTSYRALWLVMPFAVFALKGRMARVLFGVGLSGVLFASGSVADVSRSIGFAFPALVLAAAGLPAASARATRILGGAVALCLLTPAFHVAPGSFLWGLEVQVERPLILSIVRAKTGWDILDLAR